uniref:Reverse transcriptase domain-containing protein n=1 Tax=Xiphophorus couchianus TaxID=32473 RepID=A0A3B5LET9_9TELE
TELYFQNPATLLTTIPIALNLIEKFGQVSGYRLNLSKSVKFPIKKKACQMTFHSFLFTVSKNSFDYLGVCVTYDYNCLFNKNFTKALNKAKLDMEK